MDNETSNTLYKKLQLGISINIGFTIIEFFVGIISGSLALISDASHNLTDVMSLIISFFAQKIAQKKPTSEKTYGYGRATILAALINACILLFLSFIIFKKAYFRFFHPEEVEGGVIMIVGFLGILVNGGVALLFIKFRHDLNVRSALINMFYDALASAGALFAGIIIVLTNRTFIDPLISIIIGCMLLISAWRVLRDVVHLLLEGVPLNLNIEDVKKTITNSPDIIDVDDLHIWAISSGYVALSCHVIIDKNKLEKSPEIIKEVRKRLEKTYNIYHATIEVNIAECIGKICTLIK